MLIWFIDSVFGGVSEVGDASAAISMLGGGIFALLGVLLIIGWGRSYNLSNTESWKNKVRERVQEGFLYLAIALFFLIFGTIAGVIAVIFMIAVVATALYQGYRIAFPSKNLQDSDDEDDESEN